MEEKMFCLSRSRSLCLSLVLLLPLSALILSWIEYSLSRCCRLYAVKYTYTYTYIHIPDCLMSYTYTYTSLSVFLSFFFCPSLCSYPLMDRAFSLSRCCSYMLSKHTYTYTYTCLDHNCPRHFHASKESSVSPCPFPKRFLDIFFYLIFSFPIHILMLVHIHTYGCSGRVAFHHSKHPACHMVDMSVGNLTIAFEI